MIALVKTALARPLTFIFMAILIFGIGVLAILRTPVDIFPRIGVPVIATAWSYNGLSPRDMAGRIVTPYERVLTSAVNDIEHIESQSLNGVAVVKIYFQPDVDIRTATAQVTSISQTILRQLPPDITPPMIVNYDASRVPILQLALSGEGLNEQQLFDLGMNQLRPQFVSVPGVAMPFPSGGKTAPDTDRYRPRRASGARADRAGHRFCALEPETDKSGRLRRDRGLSVQRPTGQRPRRLCIARQCSPSQC